MPKRKLIGIAKRSVILTREQARFIVYCLSYDLIVRRARGFKRRTPGLKLRLAQHFGVTHSCIQEIAKRRNWRDIRAQKRKHFFIN